MIDAQDFDWPDGRTVLLLAGLILLGTALLFVRDLWAWARDLGRRVPRAQHERVVSELAEARADVFGLRLRRAARRDDAAPVRAARMAGRTHTPTETTR